MAKNKSLAIKATQGSDGDKKYLVAAHWWRQWTDFVNFDAGEQSN
jgi:hypothetical protein